MRIIRHELEITDYQTIQLSGGAELLSVAQSRTTPEYSIDLWSTDTTTGARRAGIYIVGTGHPMPDELTDPERDKQFIGTVVTPMGMVWHVFGGPVR